MRRFITLTALLLAAAIGSGQVQVSDGSPPPDPVCDLAFELAANVPELATAVASAPAPGVVEDPALLDVTIRACGSLTEWAEGAARHSRALAGRDALTRLLERCADPVAGLSSVPVCAGLGPVPGTPAADASVEPAPSVLPTLHPSATADATPDPTPDGAPATPPAVTSSTEPPGDDGATTGLVRLPRFDTRVRGADRVRTFPIHGSTPDELLLQMEQGAARVCPQHASACTLTQPRIRPRISGNPLTASCRVTGIQLGTDDTVHIPRWSGPRRVHPGLVAWWREVNAYIRWHEAQHIRIARQHLASLRKRLVGRPCSRINIEVQRMSQRLSQAQAAFDVREQGWLPPYEGPLP